MKATIHRLVDDHVANTYVVLVGTPAAGHKISLGTIRKDAWLKDPAGEIERVRNAAKFPIKVGQTAIVLRYIYGVTGGRPLATLSELEDATLTWLELETDEGLEHVDAAALGRGATLEDRFLTELRRRESEGSQTAQDALIEADFEPNNDALLTGQALNAGAVGLSVDELKARCDDGDAAACAELDRRGIEPDVIQPEPDAIAGDAVGDYMSDAESVVLLKYLARYAKYDDVDVGAMTVRELAADLKESLPNEMEPKEALEALGLRRTGEEGEWRLAKMQEGRLGEAVEGVGDVGHLALMPLPQECVLIVNETTGRAEWLTIPELRSTHPALLEAHEAQKAAA